MEIKQYVITAEGSKNYQKMVVSVTVENIKDESELETIKSWVIDQATKGVDELNTAVQATSKKVDEDPLEEKPMPRVIIKTPDIPQTQPKPKMDAKVATDYHLGDVRLFDGIGYTLCYSHKNNQWFWSINDKSLVAKGYKQYRRDDLE